MAGYNIYHVLFIEHAEGDRSVTAEERDRTFYTAASTSCRRSSPLPPRSARQTRKEIMAQKVNVCVPGNKAEGKVNASAVPRHREFSSKVATSSITNMPSRIEEGRGQAQGWGSNRR